MRFFSLFLFLHVAAAQTQPSAEIMLGDTSSSLIINDVFADSHGTLYSTGEYVDSVFNLYISAVTPQGKKFELKKHYGFDEEGYFIRPYDSTHFIVCGHSEDTTGTFNVRLLKLTMSGTIVWDTTFGNNGASTMEIPRDLEIDPEGNILVGGVSFSSEVNYLLLKFSPAGEKLWSLQTRPAENFQSTLHDILPDGEGNIHGIVYNTFGSDTSRATVFKRNGAGELLWQKHFNLSLSEERGHNLALINDTLIVAASVFLTGTSPTALAAIALTKNGEIVSYKQFPAPPQTSQIGVRDIRQVFHNTIAILNELHNKGTYILQTLILASNLSVIYSDTVSSTSPTNAAITNNSPNGFSVLRYGTEISTVHYSQTGNSIVVSTPTQFAANGRYYTFGAYYPPMVYAVSQVHLAHSEVAVAAFYQEKNSSVQGNDHLSAETFELFPAYPNPFNPSTVISYQLAVNSHITLNVYDILGREVATLVNEVKEAGKHSVRFNGTKLSSGIYFAKLQSGKKSALTKMILLK